MENILGVFELLGECEGGLWQGKEGGYLDLTFFGGEERERELDRG